MNLFPAPSIVMPDGALNVASSELLPSPEYPDDPVPAIVRMNPSVEIARIRLFPRSAINMLPEPSNAMLFGELN